MFSSATSFTGDLSDWDVSNVRNMSSMFKGAKLSTAHYNELLTGWSKLSLQRGIKFNAGNSTYLKKSAPARHKIIDTFGWRITDGETKQNP